MESIESLKAWKKLRIDRVEIYAIDIIISIVLETEDSTDKFDDKKLTLRDAEQKQWIFFSRFQYRRSG